MELGIKQLCPLSSVQFQSVLDYLANIVKQVNVINFERNKGENIHRYIIIVNKNLSKISGTKSTYTFQYYTSKFLKNGNLFLKYILFLIF